MAPDNIGSWRTSALATTTAATTATLAATTATLGVARDGAVIGRRSKVHGDGAAEDGTLVIGVRLVCAFGRPSLSGRDHDENHVRARAVLAEQRGGLGICVVGREVELLGVHDVPQVGLDGGDVRPFLHATVAAERDARQNA